MISWFPLKLKRVVRRSPIDGAEYDSWSPTVPRIPDECVECVVYLYPTEDAAQRGEKHGGSGFMLGMPVSDGTGAQHLYAVTCAHVVDPELGKSPVVRRNTQNGDTDIRNHEWTRHPGADIAVAYYGIVDKVQVFRFVSIDRLLTEQDIKTYDVGPGDEAFMCGRFISRDGVQKNAPSVRFGYISMMPSQDVTIEHECEVFVVELRSMSGFSGSPSFLWFPPIFREGVNMGVREGHYVGPWLLGVDQGNVPLWENVHDRDQNKIPHGGTVPTNSGAATIVPAWKLRELLDAPELVSIRRDAESAWQRKQADTRTLLRLD